MAKTPFQAADQSHGGAHDHHITPTRTYAMTLLALAFLMGLTIFAGVNNLSDVGPISGTIVNQTVALLIAVIKASLVVWIFMGVGHGTKLTKMWAATGFVWFFLLGLVLIDYPMRAFENVSGWEGQADKNGVTQDGSALPRVVAPSSVDQAAGVDPNAINLRPRELWRGSSLAL